MKHQLVAAGSLMFRKILYAGLALLLKSCISTSVDAQIVYASAVDVSGNAAFFYINLATCESCIVSPVSPNNGAEDIVLLQYVLFSNPADTAGSILALSNTPEFNFAAPMQTGVTCYVAAVAGNLLSGNDIIGSFNQSFSGNTGVLTVCVPGDAQPGPVSVQTTSVTDAWCICE
jgi:hypothetical protein